MAKIYVKGKTFNKQTNIYPILKNQFLTQVGERQKFQDKTTTR